MDEVGCNFGANNGLAFNLPFSEDKILSFKPLMLIYQKSGSAVTKCANLQTPVMHFWIVLMQMI